MAELSAENVALRVQLMELQTELDAARKALNLGQYNQLERLVGGAADPRAIALRARIDIDHGRYAEAEKLLAAAASA